MTDARGSASKAPAPGAASDPATQGGRILVVDDAAINRLTLQRALASRGHHVEAVVDGVEAMDALRARTFDLVLLDIEMPRKDGFETLAEIKADERLRQVPVIVISSLDDTSSVARCIEMGALDHLPKPFEPAVLHARLGAALAAKRLRDLELEYLEQVARVTHAAEALEGDAFDPAALETVAARPDALGVLARTFTRMATEVRAREEALRRQVRELTIEIDEARQAQRVAEVTDTDYFRSLRGRAAELRRAVHGSETAQPDAAGAEPPEHP
ncbi:MAG TPA: response regulator [Candidatus Limnocylindrales bacterium]|nr:response regulator [Candidatus Limnocylindrales bacterium]